MLTLLTLVLLAAPPQAYDPTKPGCRTVDGRTDCGWQCRHDSLRGVQCAKTEAGRCFTVDGQVACFDPPAHVTRVFAGSLPEPTCLARDGRVACGYGCVAGNGEVRCAQTPRGTCTSRAGEVVCADPPAVVYAVYGAETPAVQCKSSGIHQACGYGCVALPEGVRCARTPAGVCRAESGRVTCFDPPDWALCSWGRELPAPTCRGSESGPVCGYACKSVFGRTGCAGSPDGLCHVAEQGVVCFDPPRLPPTGNACLSILGLSALDGAAPAPQAR